MSLANNARDMLAQTERALARIEDGTLRRLRELRRADRQDAVDGVPACDTVPVMQAARGASLNPSDPTHPATGPTRPPAPAGALLVFAAVAAASATRSTWSPRSWPSSASPTGRRSQVVGDLLQPLPHPQPGRRVQHRHVVHLVLTVRRDRRRGRGALVGRAGCAARRGRSASASCSAGVARQPDRPDVPRAGRPPRPRRRLPPAAALADLQRRRHVHQRRGRRDHPAGRPRGLASTARRDAAASRRPAPTPS